MNETTNYNHLRDEQSSYLTQHNKNPVNWYPYGPIALQKAKDENKPIFLSIGYSSCHWCHVMAHESFEDLETAKLLNDNFVSIKIDKEELPDIDNYYQLACQIMNGRGGWPLSVFLTTDMRPYFSGTYFPKVGSSGIPSFNEVLNNMSVAFKEEFESVDKNANQIIEALQQPPTVEHKIEFEGHYPGAISVLSALKNYQDDDHGGYGTEPKFPHFAFYEWAIEHILEGMINEEYGPHIIKSIEYMLMGGIYDHARGGIHRYSVDKKWSVPHFEKMLYDQAGFLKLMAKTSLVYPSPLIYDSMIQTIEYLNKEMLSEKGYFFSAQDADSEGIEGIYFTFTKDEFESAISSFDAELMKEIETIEKWFNITEEGNFERKLNVISLNPEFKEDFYGPENWNTVRKVRQAILKSRKTRIPPATDNKGVASWNFQLLTALLDVVQYCKIESIQQAALELINNSAQGIIDTFLYEEDGKTRIKTTTTRGVHVPLIEDYIFFAEYSFRSYEVFGGENYLDNAKATVEFIFAEFYKDKIFYTRATSHTDTENYHNIHTPIFDQSHKAPIATLITLLRKWSSVIPSFKEYLQEIDVLTENLTHLSLQNPLTFGETLRALVYPDEAYRKIEVPFKWLENKMIHPFFVNLSNRFAIHYQTENEDKWQICTLTECEIQGSGIEEFAAIFSPPNKEETSLDKK